jgi:hypothetical protein
LTPRGIPLGPAMSHGAERCPSAISYRDGGQLLMKGIPDAL